MNDTKQSDKAVVVMKLANNGQQGPAEPVERRALPKGNPGGQSTDRAQQRRKVSQAANRVREAVIRKPEEQVGGAPASPFHRSPASGVLQVKEGRGGDQSQGWEK